MSFITNSFGLFALTLFVFITLNGISKSEIEKRRLNGLYLIIQFYFTVFKNPTATKFPNVFLIKVNVFLIKDIA